MDPLLLFDRVNEARPKRVISIDPATNRTYHYWHIFVPGVKAGQLYGYRAEGPFDPSSGMRFDPAKVLLDPYGRGTVVPKNYSREAACKDMRRFHFLRRTTHTALARIRSSRWTSFVIWSRRCTGQESRSFSMSCTIIRRKATTTGRH
jgi:pullulanase/glycogen debranching enzyme